MSAIGYLQQLLDAGLPLEAALTAARIHEEAVEAMRPRSSESKGAARTRRWRERKEAETASQSVTERHGDVTASQSVTDPLPLPSSPQTPQLPTPTPGRDTTRTRKGPDRKQIAEGFLAFWQAYPRKVGKDDAAKAFAKAMARIDAPNPLAVILAGVERAMPGWTDKQFIPHPSTWLNQGRWDDEAPEINTAPRARHDQQPRNPRREAKLAGYERALAAAGITDLSDGGWN